MQSTITRQPAISPCACRLHATAPDGVWRPDCHCWTCEPLFHG